LNCLSCGSKNQDKNKFCTECGAQLIITCPGCGTDNAQNSNFCAQCGSKLLQSPETDTITNELKKPAAERKQITVMFCDLVGSTALSEKLDPEEYRDILRTYQDISTEIIDGVNGFIAQHLGDGLLVYFGYPVSYEDNAERAVRAGLGIIDGLKNEQFTVGSDRKITLSVRIGIHTGLVVVDEIGSPSRSEQLALGDVPNISARIQSIGKNNKVTISGSTYKLIENKYDFTDLGEHKLKGIDTPIKLFQIKGELKQIRDFKEAAKSLTPIIGRENELELLLDRWDRVKDGEGQVALISGEAGIGKSRLANHIKKQGKTESNKVVESRCSPYFSNTYLFPIVNAMQNLLFKEEQTDEEKKEILGEVFTRIKFSDKEIKTIVSDLLTAPINPEDSKREFIKSQKQKSMTFEMLIMCLLEAAQGEPIRIIIEDLQWSDLSTQEYLDRLIDRIRKEKVFLVLTFRPEFKLPWNMRSNMSHIVLNRLTKSNVEQMVATIGKKKEFSIDFIKEIVYKTDGIPLYVEELTKMIVESDNPGKDSGDSQLKIPGTLQDSLMARLDKLSDGKEVAQLGSTFGREFTYDMISTVSDLQNDSLQKGLEELVDSEILYQKGIHPDTTYYFKHALIQDAAYQSLLKSRRKIYHKKIAEVAEKKMNDGGYDHPEYIAHNYLEAGLLKASIPFWLKSGENAVRRYAHLEAINHFKKGLECIKKIESDDETNKYELSLSSLLGGSLRVIKGFGAKEVEELYIRTQKLSEKIGDTSQLFYSLRGLSGFYIATSRLNPALELAHECRQIAEKLDDNSYMLQANYLLGATLFCKGEFKESYRHSNEGYTTYDPNAHKTFTHISGLNPGAACLFWNAHSLWFLGFPERALVDAKKSLDLSKELHHVYSEAISYYIFADIYQLGREPHLVKEYAEATLNIAEENRFEIFIAIGEILRGWTIAELEDIDKGIDEMTKALKRYLETGTSYYWSHWNTMIAEAHIKNGELDVAENMINETIRKAEKTGDLFNQAELYRNLAEISILKGINDKEMVEDNFKKSIEWAVKQHSRILELRSLVSYTKYLQSAGERRAVVERLRRCYDSFEEGYETRDLKEARSLIAEHS